MTLSNPHLNAAGEHGSAANEVRVLASFVVALNNGRGSGVWSDERGRLGRRAWVRFEEYAVQAGPGMLRLARVLSGDRSLAEDLVQDALVKLLKMWDRVDAIGDLDAYVRRMVVNEYMSWGRRRTRAATLHRYYAPQASVDVAEQVSDRLLIRGELMQLPPRQRAVIVLRYLIGLSDDDIAHDLGCSPGTVRSHASRALSALRIQLGQPAHDTSEAGS